jgi:hypothetical protein
MGSMDTLKKGMIHIEGGTEQDTIILLRIVYNVKFMNCLFPDFFHLLIFRLQLIWVTETTESETVGKGDDLIKEGRRGE